MKKLMVCFALFAGYCAGLYAQQSNAHIRQGNTLYKQKKFDQALPEYQQGISDGAGDPVTTYNFGNVLYRNSRYADAVVNYEKVAKETDDNNVKQQSLYNEGVSFSRQQKLEESIEAYKKAVLLNPADQDARINLQKALLELKKKQPPQPKKEDEKKKKQNKQDQQKQPPKSNLTKKQVEQLLKALQQREQQVQQKMQQNKNRTAGQQEKDW